MSTLDIMLCLGSVLGIVASYFVALRLSKKYEEQEQDRKRAEIREAFRSGKVKG